MTNKSVKKVRINITLEQKLDYANMDMKNNVGDTALILATRGGFDRAVSLLVSAGANLNKKNKNRQKAIEIAELLDNRAIVNIIKTGSSSNRFWPFN